MLTTLGDSMRAFNYWKTLFAVFAGLLLMASVVLQVLILMRLSNPIPVDVTDVSGRTGLPVSIVDVDFSSPRTKGLKKFGHSLPVSIEDVSTTDQLEVHIAP